MNLQRNISIVDNFQSKAKGKPFVTKDQVVSLLKESYNYEVKRLKVLDGYDDQNFLVEVAPLNQNVEADGLTTEYVLKITNSYISKAEEGLKDATRVMEFLSSKGFSCSQPVPNRNGDWCQYLTFKNFSFKHSENGVFATRNLEDTFIVRLLTFLPGTDLSKLPFVPDNVFEEIGETLAKAHIALQELDMDKKALQEVAEVSPWSLDCLNKWRDFLYVVDDLETRQLVEDVMNAFESIVLSRKEELPHSFLHGDFNYANILVDTQEGSNEPHMIGFIDFDNVCYSCTVYDVGISLMYLLLCKTKSRDSAAKNYLLGYSRYRKLSQLEKDCLFYCIAGRFVQSLLGGLYNYSMSKNEYALCTQERGWNALKDIWKRGKGMTYHNWNFS